MEQIFVTTERIILAMERFCSVMRYIRIKEIIILKKCINQRVWENTMEIGKQFVNEYLLLGWYWAYC